MKKASRARARSANAASSGPRPHRLERALDRLHHEGEGVNRRCEDEALEREGEGAPGHGDEEPAEGSARPHHEEEVEAEDGRGEDEREGDHRLDGDTKPASGTGEPPGDRGPDGQQYRHRDGGELDAQPERLEIEGHVTVAGIWRALFADLPPRTSIRSR